MFNTCMHIYIFFPFYHFKKKCYWINTQHKISQEIIIDISHVLKHCKIHKFKGISKNFNHKYPLYFDLALFFWKLCIFDF